VTETSPPPGSRTDADLVGAFLTASRVLVAMAARSLTVATEEITVPQHRALVLLPYAARSGRSTWPTCSASTVPPPPDTAIGCNGALAPPELVAN
jgi:hypothetical protein